MPIDFKCPHCQNQLMVADEFSGQTGPCMNCQNEITIPGSAPFPLETTREVPTAIPSNPYAQPMQEASHPLHQVDAPQPSELGMRILLPVDRSALAIVAGYLGLFSVLLFPAPIALIVGILAVRDIKKNPKKHGMGRAWFGIAMGGLITFGVIASLSIAAISDLN